MKKCIFLFLMFVSCLCFSQSIYNSQQIGQTGRNQNVSRGFWIKSDTLLTTAAVWIPANGGAGKVFTSDANGFGTWQAITNTAWGLTGNSGTNSATNFIGTTDNKDLILKTNGIERSRFGSNGQWITQASFSPNDTFLVSVTNNGLGLGVGTARMQHSTLDGKSGAVALDGSGFGKTRNYSVYGFTDFAAKNSFLETGYDSTSRLAWLQLQVQNNVNRYTVRLATDTGLVVNCPLYYTDGTQGADKVLTSNAIGAASWKSLYAWSLTGNRNTDSTNFIGTTDGVDFNIKTTATSTITANKFLLVDTNGNRLIQVLSTANISIGDVESVHNVTELDLNDDVKQLLFNGYDSVQFYGGGYIIATSYSNDSSFVVNNKFKYPNGTQGTGKVLTSDVDGLASWQGLGGSNGSDIPAYANNAAAFAVLGAGKLYYTDVAGEYIIKVTH